jgi:hypothetical protein
MLLCDEVIIIKVYYKLLGKGGSIGAKQFTLIFRLRVQIQPPLAPAEQGKVLQFVINYNCKIYFNILPNYLSKMFYGKSLC